MKSNGYIIKKALPEHRIIFKPATKDGLEGRPKGGMFVAVPLPFKDRVKKIPVTSARLQCMSVTVESCKLLLMNCYFPNDPRADFDETELVILLKEIETVISESSFVSSFVQACHGKGGGDLHFNNRPLLLE